MLSLTAAAVVTPFAARDYTARHRIARQQREIASLERRVNQLDASLHRVARCTGAIYPITFRDDGTIALSFNTKDDRGYVADAEPGCTP